MLSTSAHSFQSHFHLVFPFGLAGVIHLTHRPEVILIISFRGDNRRNRATGDQGPPQRTKEIYTAEIEEDLGNLRGHSRGEDPPPTGDAAKVKHKVPQSTYEPREPQCLSTRPNWDPRPPSTSSKCVPPPRNQSKGTLACSRGGGGSQFRRLEK